MDPSIFAQLGVAGIICVMQSIALTIVWKAYQAALKARSDDQAVMLPALTAASASMAEFARVAAVLRDRG